MVVSVDLLAPDHYIMTIADEELGRESLPGQFFQVRLPRDAGIFLPRPFSLHDWHFDERGGKIGFKILFKVVGKGTLALSHLRPGDTVGITGPLGNTFTMPRPDQAPVILAGGIGIAPFIAFVRDVISRGVSPKSIRLLLGARCESLLIGGSQMEALGVSVDMATDDGSCGIRGTVVDLMARLLEGTPGERIFAYASGPTPMLDALARFAAERNFAAELSLEARMICGFGACNSCAVRVKSPKDPDGWKYRLVCRDGPVFPASSLYVE